MVHYQNAIMCSFYHFHIPYNFHQTPAITFRVILQRNTQATNYIISLADITYEGSQGTRKFMQSKILKKIEFIFLG